MPNVIIDDISRMKVIIDTMKERERQHELWGEQNLEKEKWIALIVEEIGEVARACNDKDDENYREEMIQVAALAIQAVECYDREKAG